MSAEDQPLPIEATGLLHPEIHAFHPEVVNGIVSALHDWAPVKETVFFDGTRYLRICAKPAKETAVIIGWPAPDPLTMWRIKEIGNAATRDKEVIPPLAKRVIVVAPYLEGRSDHLSVLPEKEADGWSLPSLQERKVTLPGEAILVEGIAADLQQAGVTDLIVMDVHSRTALDALRARVPRVYHLTAVPLFAEKIKGYETIQAAMRSGTAMVLRPDRGASARCELFASLLGLPVLKGEKYRPRHNQTQVTLTHEGGLEGITLLMLDDVFDSFGTFIQWLQELKEGRGAGHLLGFSSAGLASGPAIARMKTAFERGWLDWFMTTNSHPHASMVKLFPQTGVLDVVPVFVDMLRSIVEPGALEADKYGVKKYLFDPDPSKVVEERLATNGALIEQIAAK